MEISLAHIARDSKDPEIILRSIQAWHRTMN